MRSRRPIASEAALFARRAEQQIATLSKAIKSMSDNVSGMQRAIHVPNLTPRGSRYTKRTVTQASPFAAIGGSILGYYAEDLLGLNASAKISLSSSQASSLWASVFQRAQRVT